MSLPGCESCPRCDGGCSALPGTEELRMLQAIAETAVHEALRLGRYHATFRGFCLDARRTPVSEDWGVSLSVHFADGAHGARAWAQFVRLPLAARLVIRCRFVGADQSMPEPFCEVRVS